MRVSEESKVEKNLIEQFASVADEGRQLIQMQDCQDSVKLLTLINDFLTNPPKKKWFKRVDTWTDRALPLGTLWGEIFVKELGWEWVNVRFEDESQAIGVFSKDRSIGFYPWHFILGCIDHGAPVTVLLAWNMLKDNAIPELEPNGYENLMDGVHHIVPAT